MSSPGVTFKRCGCRNEQGTRLEQNCPRLSDRGHGSCTSTARRPICWAGRNESAAAAFRRKPPRVLPGRLLGRQGCPAQR